MLFDNWLTKREMNNGDGRGRETETKVSWDYVGAPPVRLWIMDDQQLIVSVHMSPLEAEQLIAELQTTLDRRACGCI